MRTSLTEIDGAVLKLLCRNDYEDEDADPLNFDFDQFGDDDDELDENDIEVSHSWSYL